MPFATQLNLTLAFCCILLANVSGFARADVQPDVETFNQEIRPLLRQYCGRCHGEKKAKAKIRLDNIDPNIIAGEHFGQWEDIREAFNSGEMPPEKEGQPTPAERDMIANWLEAEFTKAKRYENTNRRGAV